MKTNHNKYTFKIAQVKRDKFYFGKKRDKIKK